MNYITLSQRCISVLLIDKVDKVENISPGYKVKETGYEQMKRQTCALLISVSATILYDTNTKRILRTHT